MDYMDSFRKQKITDQEIREKSCNVYLKCIKNDIEYCMKEKIDLTNIPETLIKKLVELHVELRDRFD